MRDSRPVLFHLTHRFRIDAAGLPAASDPMAEAGELYCAGRLDAAEQLCREIIASDPRHAEGLHLLGVICSDRNAADEALEWLSRATAVTPGNPRARYHLGNALMSVERFAEAEAEFRQAVALDPTLADAFNNLGSTLGSLQRDAEAVEAYRKALALRPGMRRALYNMGLAQARLGDLEEAVASHRAVLAQPGDSPADKLVEVHDALAVALMELERPEEALAVCRARCALQPDDPRGEWHEALALLTLGRFGEGLPKYERRWSLPGFLTESEATTAPTRVPTPTEFDGRHVLLRPDQGRGDVIQFARYATLVAARAASVTLAVPADLVELMRSVPGVSAVIQDTEPAPDHDLVAALLSLPLVFGTELATIPATVPYLRAPPDRVAAWRNRLGPRVRPRIGLCWWGLQHIPERSMPVSQLAPLLSVDGVEFHAVQKEIPPADRGWLADHPGVVLYDTALTDFAETAALLEEMDLIIAIDTSIAHLAGALGRPVWVMLRRNPDWRWFLDRADSPWYPTARLFRQKARDGWAGVIDAVRQALLLYQVTPFSRIAASAAASSPNRADSTVSVCSPNRGGAIR